MRKKRAFKAMATASMISAVSMTAFAGQWQSDSNGWWYDNGNGTWPSNAWQWIDGNGDGVSESYYFDGNGYLLTNATTPDGYQVNADGAWVVDGAVQSKPSQQSGQPQQSSGKYNEHGISHIALDLLNHSQEENAVNYGENSKSNIAGSKYYDKTSFRVDYDGDGTAKTVWYWAYLDGSIFAEKFDASVKDMFIDAPDEVKSYTAIVEDLQAKGYQCRGYYGHVYVEFDGYELEFWAINDDTFQMELNRMD